MTQSSPELLDALQKVVNGLSDPANHYMISANYYELAVPGQVKYDRTFIAIMYLHQEAAWNVALGPDEMLMDVILNQDEPDKKYHIKIPYAEIWRVQAGHSPAFSDEDQIFYDPKVFKKLMSYTLGD